MNELEFLTESVDTKYGASRAKYARYLKPWTTQYVEIGNEDNVSNGLKSYKSYRFKASDDAMTAKYSEIQVLASAIDTVKRWSRGGPEVVKRSSSRAVRHFPGSVLDERFDINWRRIFIPRYPESAERMRDYPFTGRMGKRFRSCPRPGQSTFQKIKKIKR